MSTAVIHKQGLKAKLRPYVKPYLRAWRQFKKNAKSLVFYPLRKLPVSSERFGPPKGFYLRMADWEKSLSTNSRQGYQTVAPPVNLSRRIPKTVEKKIHWIIRREYERVFPEAIVATLQKGRVWVRHNSLGHVDSTAHIANDDRIIATISDEFKPRVDQHSVFSQVRLPKIHPIKGQAVSLVTMKGEQFYHWIFDMLPKLASLQRAGIDWKEADAIIVNSQSSRFMRETMEVLGFPMDKVVDTQTHQHIKADEMIVPSTPAGVGNPTIWICQFLRDSFLPHQAKLDSSTSKRVFISRSKAQFRNVVNEPEVMECLKTYGFQAFVLEEMNYREQVALFAQAEVIVAPHGAGLSGLVYCDPGTTVIEFYSPQYVNACFYALANTMQLEYHYLLGEGKSPKEGVNLEIYHANITLNIHKLTETLKLANVQAVGQESVNP